MDIIDKWLKIIKNSFRFPYMAINVQHFIALNGCVVKRDTLGLTRRSGEWPPSGDLWIRSAVAATVPLWPMANNWVWFYRILHKSHVLCTKTANYMYMLKICMYSVCLFFFLLHMQYNTTTYAWHITYIPVDCLVNAIQSKLCLLVGKWVASGVRTAGELLRMSEGIRLNQCMRAEHLAALRSKCCKRLLGLW